MVATETTERELLVCIYALSHQPVYFVEEGVLLDHRHEATFCLADGAHSVGLLS